MFPYEKKTRFSYSFATVPELSYICRREGFDIPLSRDVSPLSGKVRLRSKGGEMVTLQNSLAVLPTNCLDAAEDGAPSCLTERRWIRCAGSGAGLVFCGPASVSESAPAGGDLFISEHNIQKYKSLINKMRAVFSGLLVLQLFADCPSEKESEGDLPALFAKAARAAFNAGFDGVEICVFPDSPSEYRSLVSKIFGAVFAVSPENAVISLKYFHNENSPDPDVVLLCDLAKKGLSAISVTAVSPDLACPSNIPQATPTRHPIADAEQLLSAATRIKNLVPDVCVIASGMSYFKELAPNVAAGAIADKACDVAGFGRMALAYESFASDFLSDNTDRKKVCVACGKCTKLYLLGETVGCPVRDQSIYLPVLRRVTGKK